MNYSELYLKKVTFDLLFTDTYAIIDTNDVSGVKPVPGHRVLSINLYCGLIMMSSIYHDYITQCGRSDELEGMWKE
jgi:hypothetical protein